MWAATLNVFRSETTGSVTNRAMPSISLPRSKECTESRSPVAASAWPRPRASWSDSVAKWGESSPGAGATFYFSLPESGPEPAHPNEG